MTIDLTPDEARALASALARHLVSLQDEVAHTAARSLQVGLHTDMDRLESILRRINTARTERATEPEMPAQRGPRM